MFNCLTVSWEALPKAWESTGLCSGRWMIPPESADRHGFKRTVLTVHVITSSMYDMHWTPQHIRCYLLLFILPDAKSSTSWPLCKVAPYFASSFKRPTDHLCVERIHRRLKKQFYLASQLEDIGDPRSAGHNRKIPGVGDAHNNSTKLSAENSAQLKNSKKNTLIQWAVRLYYYVKQVVCGFAYAQESHVRNSCKSPIQPWFRCERKDDLARPRPEPSSALEGWISSQRTSPWQYLWQAISQQPTLTSIYVDGCKILLWNPKSHSPKAPSPLNQS